MLKEDIALLDEVEKKIGVSRYNFAVKAKSRRRLEVDINQREKRIVFKWSLYKKLYNKQRGICPICGNQMALDRKVVEMDHKNPNEKDFNAEFNLQVVHGLPCNREKGGKSLAEQSKFYGKTTVQLLTGEDE